MDENTKAPGKVNKKPAPKASAKEKNVSGNRLMLLVTIVNRKKVEL